MRAAGATRSWAVAVAGISVLAAAAAAVFPPSPPARTNPLARTSLAARGVTPSSTTAPVLSLAPAEPAPAATTAPVEPSPPDPSALPASPAPPGGLCAVALTPARLGIGVASRPPIQGTERFFRERVRYWAVSDPRSFLDDARRILAGPSSEAEKMGTLRAAMDVSDPLGDEVAALALDPAATPDASFRETAGGFLIGMAGTRPWIRDRVLASVVRDPRAKVELRAAGAAAVFAALPDDELEPALHELDRPFDRSVFLSALRGLARNPSPRATELLAVIARTRSWDPEAQQVAADALGKAEDPSEPGLPE